MNNQLQTYINENLAKGVSKETIQSNLIAAGWTKEQVSPVLYPAQPKDDSLHTSPKTNFQSLRVSSILLRCGLAFVFVYAAVALSLNPAEGTHFMPSFVSHIVPPMLFLPIFAGYEVLLSVWLLSGKWHRYSGLLAAMTIFIITALNFADFTVLFRNVAIVFAGLALASLPDSRKGE